MTMAQGVAVARRSTREALRALGARVRAMREARGWSQAELAERAQTGQAHVSRVERGGEGVSLGLLYQLADALAVAPAALLDPGDGSQDTTSALCQDATALLHGMTEAQLRAFITILGALKEHWKEPPEAR